MLQAGQHTTSEIGQVLLYDRRDDRLEPSGGYYASLGNDFAGVGFGVDYIRNKVSAGYYYSVAPEWVLSVTGEAGYIFGWNGQNVLIQDRFFVGGDNLRGFQSAGIGPRDSVSGDALGGQKYYLGSVTLGVPLGLPKEFGRQRTRLHRFRDALSHPADEHRADPRPIGFDRRGTADGRAIAGDPRQRRGRRVMEIAGRPDPARYRLSDQEGTIRQDPVLPGQFRHEVLMLLWRLAISAAAAGVAVRSRRQRRGASAACAPSTCAPPPTPAPPPPPPRRPRAPMPLTVMVVDVQALLQNSKAAKMVRGQIEQKRNEYTKEISHQEETLRAERDALQRQQASLSADALNQKGREFQQKVNDLERNVQGKRQALEKSNGEALSKIQEEMLKIIADIAKQRKANLVFQRADLVLFDQSFDVTDEVLQKLDEQMPALTVNFVTPVPPPPAPHRRRAAAALRRSLQTQEEIGRDAQPRPRRKWRIRVFSIGPAPLRSAALSRAERGEIAAAGGWRSPVFAMWRRSRPPARKTSAFSKTGNTSRHLLGSRAGAAFVDEKAAERAPPGMALLVSKEPYKAYALAAQAFYPAAGIVPRRAPSALIDPAAVVPEDCDIGPNVVIERRVRLGRRCRVGANTVIAAGVEIGDDCRIGANVTLSHCLIGSRVVLHPGCADRPGRFRLCARPDGADQGPAARARPDRRRCRYRRQYHDRPRIGARYGHRLGLDD